MAFSDFLNSPLCGNLSFNTPLSFSQTSTSSLNSCSSTDSTSSSHSCSSTASTSSTSTASTQSTAEERQIPVNFLNNRLTVPEINVRKRKWVASSMADESLKYLKQKEIGLDGIEVEKSFRKIVSSINEFYVGQVIVNTKIPHGRGAFFEPNGRLYAKSTWAQGVAKTRMLFFTRSGARFRGTMKDDKYHTGLLNKKDMHGNSFTIEYSNEHIVKTILDENMKDATEPLRLTLTDENDNTTELNT